MACRAVRTLSDDTRVEPDVDPGVLERGQQGSQAGITMYPKTRGSLLPLRPKRCAVRISLKSSGGLTFLKKGLVAKDEF